MKTLPLELTLRDTCLPDYFQGFAGPSLAIPVDATTTASQLQHALVNDEAWPTGLTEDEVRTLVNACIGETALFPDIAPSDPPEQFAVRPHPTIDNMWLVIDPDLDILGSWETQGEAVLEAWGEAWTRDYVDESDMPATVYAYFGLRWTKELPEGYGIWHRPGNVDAWFWEDPREVDEGDFVSEFEATLAAWRHYLAQSEPKAEFTTYGKALPTHACRWVAGINHHLDETWWTRIQVYGSSAKDAEALRDRVLDTLTAIDEIHQILDGDPNEPGIEWDSDTVTKVARVITDLGYTIRDPEEGI